MARAPAPKQRRERLLLLSIVVTAVVAAALLLAQAQAADSGAVSGADCPHGAISAIGPVDLQGRGDTEPDVRCVVP
jgi:hypothetical protein